jgi:hypothetical protein
MTAAVINATSNALVDKATTNFLFIASRPHRCCVDGLNVLVVSIFIILLPANRDQSP